MLSDLLMLCHHHDDHFHYPDPDITLCCLAALFLGYFYVFGYFLSFWILWDILDILWPALLVLYALFSAHFGLIIYILFGIFSYLQDLLPCWNCYTIHCQTLHIWISLPLTDFFFIPYRERNATISIFEVILPPPTSVRSLTLRTMQGSVGGRRL